MAAHTLPLLALLLVAALAPAAAHYNLKSPMPYNPIDCNRPDCRGPCPPIWRSGNARARNNPSNPSAVWRRGQDVKIEWHRNNHEGGYFRRSLVPVKHMFNANWHKKTAFEWGCWSQNRFQCGRSPSCGTDKNGFAYRNTMKVPTVFPDGDYVFSMVWFGGLHWRRNKALFSDYYTCAYVRIRGGPLARSHRPTFIRGFNNRKVKPGTCASTSSFAGECGGTPCHKNPVKEEAPGMFRNGRTPPPVMLRDLDKNALANVPDASLPTEPLASEKKAEVESKIEEQRDAKWAQEAQQAEASSKAAKPPAPTKPRTSPPVMPSRASKKKEEAQRKIEEQRNAKSAKPAPPKPIIAPRPPQSAPKAGKCADMANGPQKPTGSWGPRNSPKWRQKQREWWIWTHYCERRRTCSCWN